MLKALIVEDEDLMREYLANHLPEFCEEWIVGATAADGQEALANLLAASFDGIITDIHMPSMDGLALSREIRRLDPTIPILILSGYNKFDYAREAVRLNIFDYLLKPINESELSAALSAMAFYCSGHKSVSKKYSDPEQSLSPPPGLAQQALEYIEHHYADPISLTILADHLHVSSAYLSTVFHREIGVSYSQTLLRIRMEMAAKQLTETNLQVQQIAKNVGFVSSKHFIHVFRTYYHLSPMEYRRSSSHPRITEHD